MERRKFLQQSCHLCLLSLAGFAASTIESCAGTNAIYKTNIRNKMVEVPISLLQGKKMVVVRPAESDFDIAVRPEQDGTYKAIVLACTHHDNPLNVTGNGFICMLHGSQFDLEGNVTHGPASIALEQFKTALTNDNLLIYIK